MSSCLLLHDNEPFLYQTVMCNEKWILYRQSAQWLEWEEAPKHFPSQTSIKKRSWSVSGCLLLVWLTTAFCILAKPLHLRSMLSNLMSCTKNCNAFSWFWSTERALFFSTRMPNCTFHNQHFNSWTNWAMKFCLISYIHLTSRQMTTTSSSISDNLLQGKHFHNQ